MWKKRKQSKKLGKKNTEDKKPFEWSWKIPSVIFDEKSTKFLNFTRMKSERHARLFHIVEMDEKR